MKNLAFLLLAFVVACSSGSKTESTSGSFFEAPIASLSTEKPVTRIAFGSCAHQKKPQPIWNAILEQKPDLYIGMGDNVYASKPEDQPIAEQYRLQSAVPEFQKFRSQVPVIGMWDDHDYGLNDGGANNPKFAEAKAAYLQFFPEDAKLIPQNQMGLQHSFVLGQAPQRVQIIMLDTRTYRSDLERNPTPKTPLDKFVPTSDSTKTVLGEEQWKWLEEELKKPAEIRLLVSSIQVLPEKHGFEKWANFPHERKRLLDLLKKTGAKNAVILSGDRHLAEVSRLEVPGHGSIYDITSSSLNSPTNIEKEVNPLRVGNFIAKENFGLVQIDWAQKKIHFDLRNIQGLKVRTVQRNIH